MKYSFSQKIVFSPFLLAVTLWAVMPQLNAQQPVDSKLQPGIIVLTAYEGDVKISLSSNGQALRPSKGAILKQGQSSGRAKVNAPTWNSAGFTASPLGCISREIS